MPAVHDRVDMAEPGREKTVVGVELERRRVAARVGDAAVGGGDDIAHDAEGADHAEARYS